MKTINKAYKLRIYPNKKQKELIDTTINSCRFVYNYYLDMKIKTYKETGKSMSKYDCNNHCNRELKKELEWLKNSDKFALTNSIYDLDTAYQNFFREVKKGNDNQGYPKFKSKKTSKLSYRTNFTNNNIEIKNSKIKLPRLSWINFRDGRDLSNIVKIYNVTVTKTKTNKYYASVCVDECWIEKESTGSAIGIDLGLKEYVITSNNEFYNNPKFLRQSEDKLMKLHRKHSRKKKGAKNKEKARLKLAKQYEKVTNQRRYFQHQLSTKLTNENQVVVLETLKSSNMVKNHKLAKSISDASWYEFTRQLEYKGLWNDRNIIKIGQFFPSSQLCSCCGEINKQTKDLNYRDYVCDSCGLEIDRDYNASLNILNEGLRLLENKPSVTDGVS